MTDPTPVTSHPRRLRIAIGGIAIESSTFSPHVSTRQDFRVLRGQALLDRHGWLAGAPAWSAGIDWLPVLRATALPGGPVDTQSYDTLQRELLDETAKLGPLDGFLLDIHGAMNVAGRQDAEGDLAAALRELLGPDAWISAAMDLHGNVSAALVDAVDLITCYRTAPHVDEPQTRERAARLLAEQMRLGQRPFKAWVPIPVLLPGEKTSTRISPGAELYAAVTTAAERAEIVDAAMWVGYAWADEPRAHATVVVTADSERAAAEAAQELASAYWEARERFTFVAPVADLDTCVAAALASDVRPYVISDSGDNPTAGGAGDVTYGMRRLLATPAIAAGRREVLYASITDPETVAAAFSAGPGAEIEVHLGGKIDAREGGPIDCNAVVCGLFADRAGGRAAVLRIGGVRCIVTERRAAFHTHEDYASVGVTLAELDLLVVKIGYLEPDLYAAANGWMLALTPGGVSQDLTALTYEHITRPSFPLDDVDQTPPPARVSRR